MTEPTNPPPHEDQAADETFTWTQPPAAHGTPGAAATTILESVRDAVDELAERAGPSVREFSARAAELAAIAADRAAPLAKRAGEVTADASGKLATLSRTWAADLRASMPAGEPAPAPAATPSPEPAVDVAEDQALDGAGGGTSASGGPSDPI
jgi:hypothetical protein